MEHWLILEQQTPEGFTKTKVVDVSANDTIDLALTPVGPNGDRSDGSDGSFFSMTISTISTGTDPLLADSDGDGYDDGTRFRLVVILQIQTVYLLHYSLLRLRGSRRRHSCDRGAWGNDATVGNLIRQPRC